MINEKIMDIIIASIPVIGVLITGILIPFVRAKLNEDQRDKVVFWAEIAAVAIEKHYEGEIGKGQIKKAYVMDFLINTLKFDKFMTSEQLDIVIDAVVEQIINAPQIELECAEEE